MLDPQYLPKFFQSGIVLGKNEYVAISICSYIQLQELLIILVIVKGDGAGKHWVGMCIILFRNLKSKIKHEYLIHSSSDG